MINDVGGAFGLKGLVYREDVAVAAASKLLGQPVKWIEDRVEHLMASAHAREENVEVEAAVQQRRHAARAESQPGDGPGLLPAAALPSRSSGDRSRDDARARTGCRPSSSTRPCPSNKATYVAYRGPWEVETWVRERLLDMIARELSLDPVEIGARTWSPLQSSR